MSTKSISTAPGATYLRTLIANVMSQAKRAIRRTEARAFCRTQIAPLRGYNCALISASVQEPVTADKEANAKLRLAESKTMKKRSSRISRAFAEGDRRPRGFDVYSSKVM